MEIEGGRFLIAGGASLIGMHITDALLSAGAREVVLFDNLSLGSRDAIGALVENPAVRFVRGDVLRLNQIGEAMSGMNGTFLLAAYLTLPFSHSPAMGAEVNVMGTVNALEAARLLGIPKLVFTSSIAVYGNEVHGPVNETTPFGSAGLSPAFSAYASSKLLGESLGRLYAQKYGIDFCTVRYSTVYGENQHSRGVNALYILEAMEAVRSGTAPTIPGDGKEAHDFLYAGDAARGAILAMAKGSGGAAYNIVTGRSTSINEVVDIVLKEYGSNLKPRYVIDARTAKSTAHDRLDLSRQAAWDVLQWEPRVTLTEGVSRLRRWLEAGITGRAAS